MKNFENGIRHSRLLLLCALGLLLGVPAGLKGQAPDLTAGNNRSTVKTDYTVNLGPTGLRGRIYGAIAADTSHAPLQILVTSVGANTPVSGSLAVNDVILGDLYGGGHDDVERQNDLRDELDPGGQPAHHRRSVRRWE